MSDTVFVAGDKVKCIRADDPNGVLGSDADFLVLGKIYTVYKVGATTLILVGRAYAYYSNRFELVDNDAVSDDNDDQNSPLSSDCDDPEEERLRNLLKPHRAANECACGIVRAQCSYHGGS